MAGTWILCHLCSTNWIGMRLRKRLNLCKCTVGSGHTGQGGWAAMQKPLPPSSPPPPPAPPNLVPKAPPASLGMVGTLLSWIDAGASGGRHRLTCTPTAPQSQSCPITAFPILEIYLHSLFRPYICNPYSHNLFAFPVLAIYLHYLFSQYICIHFSNNISAFPTLELYICYSYFQY